jgi:hypothetical protein
MKIRFPLAGYFDHFYVFYPFNHASSTANLQVCSAERLDAANDKRVCRALAEVKFQRTLEGTKRKYCHMYE